MAKFTYSGPLDTVELRTGTAKVDGSDAAVFTDIALVPGGVIDLPDGSSLVARLTAAGHLAPVADAKPTTSRATRAAKTDEEAS